MRIPALALVLAVAAASCTGAGPATPSPSGPSPAGPASPSGPTGAAPLALDVVAAMEGGGGAVEDDRTYLEGMRLAVAVTNRAGGVGGRPLELRTHDDGGDAARTTSLVRGLLSAGSSAILVAGPGGPLLPLRARFAETGTPVVLLGGDLYTSRQLFPQAFQTSIPWAWQVHVIARYLVLDREAGRVAFVGTGPTAAGDAAATRAAMSYWGGSLAASVTLPGLGDLGPAVEAARSADAVIVHAPPLDSTRLVGALRGLPGPPRISGGSALLVETRGTPAEDPLREGPPVGATACSTYTWAGWNAPIPRVRSFVAAFEGFAGHAPGGFEQEGFDAVRSLAVALASTEGRGGAALVRAMEAIRYRAFSGVPVTLGPDDHVFPPRDELGLFAVAGPHERLDPWQTRGGTVWRALMRTFTYDGERDNILDRDRRVFFPFWRAPQPGPEYWRSRYGIVTRPGADTLH